MSFDEIEFEECPECGGDGVTDELGVDQLVMPKPCPVCGGTGVVVGE